MKTITEIFYFLLAICDIICIKYDNYTLYRGIASTTDHFRFFKSLSDIYNIDFWRPPGMLKKPIEFTIAPEDKSKFLKESSQKDINWITLMDDVQSAFDLQTVKTYIRRNMDSFDWSSFFKLDDIYNWLKDLSKAHPTEMQIQSIGTTYENRKILAARVVLKGSLKRSTVIVEGGIHAREWIAPAFVTYFLHQILNAAHSNNTALRTIARTYEWYFIPVLNADGYEYTHSEDRLWRKNRHEQGVDLNRNFGIAFGTVGISKQKNSDVYSGDKAFSERESTALAKFIRSKSDSLEYYLAFHSYGQYIIIPYAHSKQHLENFDEMSDILQNATKEILQRYGTKYTVGTAYDTVGYRTSGVSGCWAKKVFNIPYVATFELRDSGHHGFALPPDQIIPTCLETMDGIISILTPRNTNFIRMSASRPTLRNRERSTYQKEYDIVFEVILVIIARFC